MGEVTLTVMKDISFLMTTQPFVYVTGTVICASIVTIFRKMF